MEEKIRTRLKDKYGITDISKYGVMHLSRSEGVMTLVKLKGVGTCPKCNEEYSLYVEIMFSEKNDELISETARCYGCDPRV